MTHGGALCVCDLIAKGELTLSGDICPGPFKEVDLHSGLPWNWAGVGEEAVRLPCCVPAAPCCPAGCLSGWPEQACMQKKSLLSAPV